MRFQDIASARLYNHQIDQHRFKKIKDLVGHMGAMQAQDYAMSKLAIGLRVAGATEQQVEKSLNKAELLRAHVLRPTWHIIPATDIYWMLDISAKKIKALMKTNDTLLELTGKTFVKSNTIIGKCLREGKHVTRDEIALRLNKAHIHTNENRLSHLLMRSELEGIACSGKSRNHKRTYALLEKRVPRPAPISREDALALLAKKYFISHGLATLPDFAWWAGLTLTDSRNGLESVKSQLANETIAGNAYWFDPTTKTLSIKSESIHFLPAYDEFIISYKDRRASLMETHRKKVVSSNGIFNPVIVINGQVTGTWKRSFQKDQVIMEPHFFHAHNKIILGKLEKKLSVFTDFYGKEAVLIKPATKK